MSETNGTAIRRLVDKFMERAQEYHDLGDEYARKKNEHAAVLWTLIGDTWRAAADELARI